MIRPLPLCLLLIPLLAHGYCDDRVEAALSRLDGASETTRSVLRALCEDAYAAGASMAAAPGTVSETVAPGTVSETVAHAAPSNPEDHPALEENPIAEESVSPQPDPAGEPGTTSVLGVEMRKADPDSRGSKRLKKKR